MASAAQTGWPPVANATTVSTRFQSAAATAMRREIPDGPPEAAATIALARADKRVALKSGRAALDATPATRPPTR